MAKKVTKVRKTRKKSKKVKEVKDSQKPWKISIPKLTLGVSAVLLGTFLAILITIGIVTSFSIVTS